MNVKTNYLSDIQPQLFPRLHYFSRMFHSHHFVFRDDVQFVRNHRYPNGERHSSYQIHTPVLGGQGVQLLNSQVKKKSRQILRQQQISYEPDWTKKFVNMLDECYRNTPRYQMLRAGLVELLQFRHSSVAELNIQTTLWALCQLLQIDFQAGMRLESVVEVLSESNHYHLRHLALGSELLAESNGAETASERIMALCRISGCEVYIAGGTAIDSYFELETFKAGGVKVCRQNWNCDEYCQFSSTRSASAQVFEPNLSIIDLLANLEADKALYLLTSNFSLENTV